MKWKFLLAGLLVIGLLGGGTTSAFVGSTTQPITGLTATSAEEIACGLDGIYEAEIMPSTKPGDKVTIDGGFRGVWGTMGEEPKGKPWGRYGRMPQVEAKARLLPHEVEPQLLPKEAELQILHKVDLSVDCLGPEHCIGK